MFSFYQMGITTREVEQGGMGRVAPRVSTALTLSGKQQLFQCLKQDLETWLSHPLGHPPPPRSQDWG